MATADDVRAYLDRVAASGDTVTYQEAARDLAIPAPHSIHKLTQLLEQIMEDDAAAGSPLRAALIISRTRQGLPAPGFFARARALGRYDGAERGAEAAAFHERELAAVWARMQRT